MSQMETAVHSSLKTHINQSLTSFLPPLVIGLPQEYSTHGLLCRVQRPCKVQFLQV